MLENFIQISRNRKLKGFSDTIPLPFIFILLAVFIAIYLLSQQLLTINTIQIENKIVSDINADYYESSIVKLFSSMPQGSDINYAEMLGYSYANYQFNSNLRKSLDNIFMSQPYKIELKSSGKTSTLSKSGTGHYTAGLSQIQFIVPCDARKTSGENSGYGWRIRPLSGGSGQFHYGIDLPWSGNCHDVYAAVDGKVIHVYDSCTDNYAKTKSGSYCNGNFGNLIVIGHSFDGNKYQYLTYYAHLDKVYVKENDYVSSGDSIAKVGSTGYSSGSHLDFRTTCGYDTNFKSPNYEYTMNPCELFVDENGNKVEITNCNQDPENPEHGKCSISVEQLSIDYSDISMEVAIPGAVSGNTKTDVEIFL